MSLKKLHILINTIIFILIICISFGCKTDVNTMIVDYGSMYGVAETYDSSPAPGDPAFVEKDMLEQEEYCCEIGTMLQIDGPSKCGSYRWKFETIIENELVEKTDIICEDNKTLESSVLLIYPDKSGFEVGKTYYLTLTVTGKGGGVQYSDRAIVIFYEDRLKYSR